MYNNIIIYLLLQAIVEYRSQGKLATGCNGKEQRKPNFRIELSRKFEPSELCQVFVGRWLKIVYLIILTCYTFLACLSFSTVAGSAWSINIPLNFSGVEQCSVNEFKDHILPLPPCRNAYWFCLFLFACIVVPLSLIELKEQVIVQVALGILRFVTIGAIVIFCIANLIEYPNVCFCHDPWADDGNGSLSDFGVSHVNECNVTTSIENTVTHFDGKAWLVAIPVFVYAHILHQGIPALTHPVKEKQWLRSYFSILFLVIAFVYMILGVTVSLWFRNCTVETCTLNWVCVQARVHNYKSMQWPINEHWYLNRDHMQ